MANVTDDFAPTTVVYEVKKSRGCLYGCLFLVAGAFALILCTGLAGYWFVSSTVTKYTSETPVALPAVEYMPEQLVVLETRLKTFNEALEKGESPGEDLVMTAEEINALISKEEKLKGKVFIKIKDGLVSADVSIPTDMIPGGKGRYFNGSASLDVEMANGRLFVTLAAAEANGEPVPQEVIDAMAGENLAKEFYRNPEQAKILNRIEDVSIEGDKIILKVRRDPPEAEESKDGATQQDASPAGESAADESAAGENAIGENAKGESTPDESPATESLPGEPSPDAP